MTNETTTIGFLIYPGLTQLDFTGAFEILARVPGAQIHVIWKTKDVVTSDTGLKILPSTSISACPNLDIICIPGGPGQVQIMEDQSILEFVARQGMQAKYVTSVCTGSLLLGAAGLLQGYRATSHWMWVDMLSQFGAIPTKGRVVRDRNRLTGGGVTAGIDFALTLAAELCGEEMAQAIQLGVEYNPDPPFNAGSPKTAPHAIVEGMRSNAINVFTIRKDQSEETENSNLRTPRS